MLYKQNQTPRLEARLFRNPTSEYRGTPFWAWNSDLEQKEILRQIDVLQEMGFGGFHMHARSGLRVEYLGDYFMQLVTDCVNKAEEKQMLAWLYDEYSCPSGMAGGMVAKENAFRVRFLRMLPEELLWKSVDEDIFLSAFDISLDENGCLADYKKIDRDTPAENKWYAFLAYGEKSASFFNESYVNTLDKPSIDRFIALTYELYKDKVGEQFGKTVPAIFTDEPQFIDKQALHFACAREEVRLPWTYDFAESFEKAYGRDIIGALPELLWELPEGRPSQMRYFYHDHVTERFVCAFADNIGAWCDKNGIALTGHMMSEESLQTQTRKVGDAMRSYRSFGIPGMDLLCECYEFTTAKQVQSAVHQYAKEAMLSEMYGVTNWDYDFRGHKLQGDWQAALGVTVRVPHLAWASMHGVSKRDFPASINYQSPWYKEYSYIEDHFSRLNTAMTRGKPVVRVAMLHPIESYWLRWGVEEQTGLKREQLDESFHAITQWLLYGMIDFDFLCEAELPHLCEKGGFPLKVGAMEYDTVVVPCCETLRSTTLERLEQFREAGGRVIFIGKAPEYENALPGERGKKLYARSVAVDLDRASVLNALREAREIEVRTDTGGYTDNMIYQLRQDNDCRWLFMAHAKDPLEKWQFGRGYAKNISRKEHIIVKIKGEYALTLYDTLSGEIKKVSFRHENGNTYFETDTYYYDSFLLRLEEGGNSVTIAAPAQKEFVLKRTPSVVPVTLSEPNVCVCDLAEYSIDGAPFRAEEETLRIAKYCKNAQLDWSREHRVTLRFTVFSELVLENVALALEDMEKTEILWNGEKVANIADGWFTDICIKKVRLPKVQRGKNELQLTIPFGKESSLEWCYLLGDFCVKLQGTRKTLTAPVKELGFGDIVPQGFPFYGGNITYHIPVTVTEDGKAVEITASQYHGALIHAAVDGKSAGRIVFNPYQLTLEGLSKGEHTVDLTLFGTRVNTFGQLHLVLPEHIDRYWYGSQAWKTEGESWSYEYQLHSVGILAAPMLKTEQ